MPTKTAPTAVRMLVRVGTWDTAGALALALLVVALRDEDRLPADALVVVAVLLGAVGLGCLVLASFSGPAPFWREEHVRDGWAAVALMSAPVVLLYAWLSVPLAQDPVEWSWTLFGIAVACGAASIRAHTLPVAAVLACFAAGLLWMTSPVLGLLWVHGGLAMGLIGLVVLAYRTRTDWIRALSIIGIVLGGFLWLYAGIAVWFIVSCESGGACLD